MNQSEPNFDRVAHLYRWAEYLTLGPLLQQTRTHFLPQLTERRQALVLGDGDGRFLAHLLHQNPSLQALAVDTSATMLHLLRNRCAPFATRLHIQQSNALHVTLSPSTDLIVTHFFLDCLTQSDLDALADRLAAASQPGTLWLLSDFQIPNHSVLRPLAALYIRALYLAFRLLTNLRVRTLPNPEAALSRASFTRIAHHETLFGLLYTEIWRRD